MYILSFYFIMRIGDFMKSNTRKITEGAMIVAMIGSVLFIDRQLANMFTTNFNWLLSIPMILYSVQNDRKYSLMVFFSALFVGFLVADIQTLFYLFSALLIGVIYGEGIRNKWNHGKLLLWTIGCTFVCYLFSMYIFAGFFGYDLIATRNEFISFLENLEIMGMEVVLLIDATVFFHIYDITFFFLLVVVESLCVHLLAHLIFIKLGYKVEKIKIDLNFKYPKVLAVGGLLSLLAMLSLRWFEFHVIVEYILAFFYLSLFIVNLLYGMIVIRCMRHLPKWFWPMSIVIPIFWPAVMIVGVVDGLVDGKIRKRGLYGQVRKL